MAAQPKLSVFKKAIDQIVENVKNKYYGSNPLCYNRTYFYFVKY